MRRILFSLVMIAATVGIVTASAYALFTDTADVKGVSISSGNAYLKINNADNINDADWFTDNVYPGWIGGKYFYLTNVSNSNIGLDISAHLNNADQDWGTLKDQVKVALIEYANSTDANDAISAKNPGLKATANTGWKTLSDWNTSTKNIGTRIDRNSNHFFVFWAQVDPLATSSISGKATNTSWVLTATQGQ